MISRRSAVVLCISSLLGLAAVAAAPDVLHSAASVVLPGWLGASLRPGNGTQAAGWRWQYGSPRPLAETLELIKEENTWKNSLVLGWLEPQVRDRIPRLAQSWIRNFVLVTLVYYGVGAIWSYYIYFCFGHRLFRPGGIPTLPDVVEQMKVSTLSMPLYSLLPALTEYAAEQGWTMAYARVSDVGLPAYIGFFALYMLCVEFAVYWNHRNLHHPLVYKYLHITHHKYNKEHTMSPFAGLAFNALDGITQAIPYTWTLWFVPMHFLTHELLLFATGVWTCNIHDNIHGKVFPIMGAMYHTIHHTLYKFNHGHYTVLFDWLFGTLLTPEEYEIKYPKAAELGRSRDD